MSVTIEECEGMKPDSFDPCDGLPSDDSSSIYSCTDEDLRMGAQFFDFDLEVVKRALNHDSSARDEVFEHLACKFDQIERRIVQLCPGWTKEQQERVRDLFFHDRFVKILFHPPKQKIENFNALCWKFLHDSIADTWRFYRCAKRNFQIEISADRRESDDDNDFWERHGAEIILKPSPLPSDLVERSDLMALVRRCLATLSPQKRKVINLWKMGHSEKEIASMVNMTKSNVESIIHRVIKKLREKLCKKVV